MIRRVEPSKIASAVAPSTLVYVSPPPEAPEFDRDVHDGQNTHPGSVSSNRTNEDMGEPGASMASMTV